MDTFIQLRLSEKTFPTILGVLYFFLLYVSTISTIEIQETSGTNQGEEGRTTGYKHSLEQSRVLETKLKLSVHVMPTCFPAVILQSVNLTTLNCIFLQGTVTAAYIGDKALNL